MLSILQPDAVRLKKTDSGCIHDRSIDDASADPSLDNLHKVLTLGEQLSGGGEAFEITAGEEGRIEDEEAEVSALLPRPGGCAVSLLQLWVFHCAWNKGAQDIFGSGSTIIVGAAHLLGRELRYQPRHAGAVRLGRP